MAGEIPAAMIQYIEHNSIPAVHFGSSTQYVEDSIIVNPDNFYGAYQAVMHLISLGHKRIAFITPNLRKISFVERMRGYVAALIETGISFNEAYYRYEGQGQLSGEEVMPMFLGMDEPPTAIFCVTDATAFGALKYCMEEGISVPQQLSIVGFDDTRYAQYSVPALTTVRQPMLEAGRVAVSELFELIADAAYIPRKVLLKTKLVIRASTSAPAEDSPK